MTPGYPPSRSGRREATFLMPAEWAEAGAWLQSRVEESGVSKRGILAAMGYVGGTNRLNSYYRGDRLLKPKALRAICEAAKISYVEAVDRFGYYREIIKLLDDLTWLGERWLEEDDAWGQIALRLGEPLTPLASVRDTGVMHWHGNPITWGKPTPWPDRPGCDPRDDPSFNKRYCIATWRDAMPRVARGTPKIVREAVKHTRTTVTVAPKPIGVAIQLAVLAFPRRGDVYKENAREYREELGREAHALVNLAKSQRSEMRTAGRPKKLPPFLQRASDALDDSRLPFDLKRPMAAEYVVAWADAICQPFTHYARLAAFEYWGEAGSTISNVTAFVQLPQLRKAELLPIDTLTTY